MRWAMLEEVTAAVKGLITDGLEPGGRIVVMSRTRYERTVLGLATWAAGGGLLTPSPKLGPHEVTAAYAKEIAALYGD
jgi:long-subunit acyl-CoA synthetase (AMP-forming)